MGGTRVGSRVPDVAAVDRAGWESRVGEVAVSRTDRVTVAEWRCVQGLERRVVVWLADRRGEGWPGADPYQGLVGLSRCTSQLVIVSPPPGDTLTHTTHTTQHTHQHPTQRRR